MKVSSNFNRYLHGVLLKEIVNARFLRISTGKNGDKMLVLRPFHMDKDSLKQLFKVLDFNYPLDKNAKPLSYTKLNTKELVSHALFLEMTLADNGILIKRDDYV